MVTFVGGKIYIWKAVDLLNDQLMPIIIFESYLNFRSMWCKVSGASQAAPADTPALPGRPPWQSSPGKPRQPCQPTEQYNAEIWGRILLAHSHIQCTWGGIHLCQTYMNIPTCTWKVSYFAIIFLFNMNSTWLLVPLIYF